MQSGSFLTACPGRWWFQRAVPGAFQLKSRVAHQWFHELGKGHPHAFQKGVGGGYEKCILETG
jgi:hypothetical protein